MAAWTTESLRALVKLRAAGGSYSDIAMELERTESAVKYQLQILPNNTRKSVSAAYRINAAKKKEAVWRESLEEAGAIERPQYRYNSWGMGPLARLRDREHAEHLIAKVFSGELTEEQAQRMAAR